ncbi:hypothetical protein ACG7TL_008531 [Trametes sanguinea]
MYATLLVRTLDRCSSSQSQRPLTLTSASSHFLYQHQRRASSGLFHDCLLRPRLPSSSAFLPSFLCPPPVSLSATRPLHRHTRAPNAHLDDAAAMMAESTNVLAGDVAPPRTSADSRTEFIEQIFQKVEEESERRAQEQLQYEEAQARQQQSRVASPALTSSQLPLTPTASIAGAGAGVSGTVRERDRRRGSISVSRFGQIVRKLRRPSRDPIAAYSPPELGGEDGDDSAWVAADAQDTTNPSALPSRTNSVIINAGNTGAFYQAQRYAGSADSFASSHSSSSRHPPRSPFHPNSNTARHYAHADDEELEQVTQMATIAGKVSIGKAVGGLIARRLSMSRGRTRSRDILTSPAGLVIGVSVEEATTEVECADEAEAEVAVGAVAVAGVEAPLQRPPMSPRGTSFVYADAQVALQQQQQQAPGTRSRRSTLSMPGSSVASIANGSGNGSGDGSGEGAGAGGERRLSAAGWVAKAKDLTRKFRRRSMAVLPQNSAP